MKTEVIATIDLNHKITVNDVSTIVELLEQSDYLTDVNLSRGEIKIKKRKEENDDG